MSKSKLFLFVLVYSSLLNAIEYGLPTPSLSDTCPYSRETLGAYIEADTDFPRSVAIIEDTKSKKIGWTDPELLARDILDSKEFGKNRLTQNYVDQVDVVRFSYNNGPQGFFMRHSGRKQYPREALIRFALAHAPIEAFEVYFASNGNFNDEKYLSLLTDLPHCLEVHDKRISQRAQLLLGILKSEMGIGAKSVKEVFSLKQIKKSRVEGCEMLRELIAKGIDSFVDPNIFVMASAQFSLAQMLVLDHVDPFDALKEIKIIQEQYADRATVRIQKFLRDSIEYLEKMTNARSPSHEADELLRSLFGLSR